MTTGSKRFLPVILFAAAYTIFGLWLFGTKPAIPDHAVIAEGQCHNMAIPVKMNTEPNARSISAKKARKKPMAPRTRTTIMNTRQPKPRSDMANQRPTAKPPIGFRLLPGFAPKWAGVFRARISPASSYPRLKHGRHTGFVILVECSFPHLWQNFSS